MSLPAGSEFCFAMAWYWWSWWSWWSSDVDMSPTADMLTYQPQLRYCRGDITQPSVVWCLARVVCLKMWYPQFDMCSMSSLMSIIPIKMANRWVYTWYNYCISDFQCPEHPTPEVPPRMRYGWPWTACRTGKSMGTLVSPKGLGSLRLPWDFGHCYSHQIPFW